MDRDTLHTKLMALILKGKGDFGALALETFAHQFARNLAYQRYCQNLGQTPAQITHWQQIPTVPTDVFRHLFLFCGDKADVGHTFRTSGTTAGLRGQHHLRDLALYHASAETHLARLLLPDGVQRPALMLAPSPETLPDSSLSSMLGLIADRYTHKDTLFAWNEGALDLEAALTWLEEAQSRSHPVQVLSTSFALVFLMDEMAAQNLRFALPQGSTLMTTGGTKGRTRMITTQELEDFAAQNLGMDPDLMAHEYGMTELGSQFYDPRHLRKTQGLPRHADPVFQGPAWCRVTLHDPDTLAPVPQGQRGLLRFTDLSNLDSVCSIQTSDMGSLIKSDAQGDTLRLHGRLAGATPRGCSLMIEEAQRGS